MGCRNDAIAWQAYRCREGGCAGLPSYDNGGKSWLKTVREDEPIRWDAPMSVQDGEGREGGVGPFVTFAGPWRPGGGVARGESRRHRKHLHGLSAAGSTWWASAARGWWIAVLFAVGSLLFALGGVPAYASAVGTRSDAVTFFIGSLFFTAAGFLTYREAVDAGPQPPGGTRRVAPGGASSSSSPAGWPLRHGSSLHARRGRREHHHGRPHLGRHLHRRRRADRGHVPRPRPAPNRHRP